MVVLCKGTGYVGKINFGRILFEIGSIHGLGNYRNVERVFKRFLAAMNSKCLLQVFLSVQQWEGCYLRIMLSYVCLRYLQLKN